MTLVVDASVAVKWFVPEEWHEDALLVLARAGPLRAPDLIVPEVGNIAWKKLVQGSVTHLQAQTMVMSLPHYMPFLDDSVELIERALEIALALKHPVYDCLYLALAESLGSVVVTADEKLVRNVKGSPFAGLAAFLPDWAAEEGAADSAP